jgi:hypothetical protein
MKKPSDFKKGEVYRMAVASRSHVKKPYYVIINDTGRGFIETYILSSTPGKFPDHGKKLSQYKLSQVKRKKKW